MVGVWKRLWCTRETGVHPHSNMWVLQWKRARRCSEGGFIDVIFVHSSIEAHLLGERRGQVMLLVLRDDLELGCRMLLILPVLFAEGKRAVKEWQVCPVMQQLQPQQHHVCLHAGGGRVCLLAAHCSADSFQGYSCVATSRGRSENAVASVPRDDRNFSARWLPSDALVLFFFCTRTSFQSCVFVS